MAGTGAGTGYGTSTVRDVYSIADRLKIINDQAFASLRDPAIRALALETVRGTSQHGDQSELEELKRVFFFVKNNIEYRQDPHKYDLYATAARVLQTGAGDCFTLDTKVIVRSKATGCYEVRPLGYLKAAWPAYDALSYDFSKADWVFKPITAWQDKGTKEVFESALANGPTFRHTADHRVWWLNGSGGNSKHRVDEGAFSEKFDDDRSYMRRVLIAKQIPALGVGDVSREFSYLSGIYAAEGYSDGSHVQIAQDKATVREKIEKVLAHLDVPFSQSKRTHSAYYSLLTSETKTRLKAQGTSSFNMGVDPSVLGGSTDAIAALVEGHCDGDGWVPQVGSPWEKKTKAIHATSSEQLADELQLALMILGEPWYTQLQLDHMGVGRKPIYRVHRWTSETRPARRSVPDLPGLSYSGYRRTAFAGEDQVCDISVADTHNFVLSNGMLAHNCDCHTILVNAMIGNLGYIPGAKVVSADNANWHIYAVTCVFPRHNPEAPTARYVALDTTQTPSVLGWEPPRQFQRYSKLVTFTDRGPSIRELTNG
jgi:hypothetical protein